MIQMQQVEMVLSVGHTLCRRNPSGLLLSQQPQAETGKIYFRNFVSIHELVQRLLLRFNQARSGTDSSLGAFG